MTGISVPAGAPTTVNVELLPTDEPVERIDFLIKIDSTAKTGTVSVVKGAQTLTGVGTSFSKLCGEGCSGWF